MKLKLKWKVQTKETGRYASFHKRGWPDAEYENGDTAAMITCKDSYSFTKAKSGNHEPLTILLEIITMAILKNMGMPELLKIKATFPNLTEAKNFITGYLERHPEFYPKDFNKKPYTEPICEKCGKIYCDHEHKY